MNVPSLLRLSHEAVTPDTVFDDLQLRRLFSEKTVQILRHGCTEEELLKRQELFSVLETEGGYKKLGDCHVLLKEFDRTVRVWQASSVEMEKLLLFVQMLRTYTEVCDALASFMGNGEILSAVSAYWQEKKTVSDALKAELVSCQPLLDKICAFDVTFAERQWMTVDTVPTTYQQQLFDAAEQLGIPMAEHRIARIKLSDALSHALSELHGAEIADLFARLDPYQSLEIKEPLAYIPEFDFLFEVMALCKKAKERHIPICYPRIAKERCYLAKKLYDVSLFAKESENIVPNDTYFDKDTPFFFLTGANGGGKTTYLRACGINLVLFLAGCPVFAESAVIYPYAAVLTHFPADERFSAIGRLEEEAQRVTAMLDEAGKLPSAFLLFNETFSGTDDKRGCELTLDTADRIRAMNGGGLFVTHFHEVRAKDFPILNTVVDKEEGHKRTFHIVRDLGMLSSFAEDILKKYRLDELSLKERELVK